MNIKIENLKKCFGEKTAVDIDAFEIKDGEMLGLVGNNGAGKTTLFRLMLDLLKADDGKVEFAPLPEGGCPKDWGEEALPEGDHQGEEALPESVDVINPAESEEWKHLTGAYIDEGFLIDFLTPEEYFEFIGKVCGMTAEAIAEREKDFEQLMAGEIMGQKKLIRDFSAGNKQKIGIVAALFNRPQLVVLDEPFNFLDPSSQNVLKHLLTNYNRETGATILISSHNLQHTVDISTRIALLENGRIINDLPNESGSAEKTLEAYFNV